MASETVITAATMSSTPASRPLDGRVALVTGASQGLGAAIAAALGAAGARVVVTARQRERGIEAATRLRERGIEAEFHAQDATRSSDWASTIEFTTARFGTLDVLVNNVGVNIVKPWTETAFAEFVTLTQTNLLTTLLGVQHGAAAMRCQGRGGSIINIASAAAFYGHAQVSPYCAAKAAVGELSRAAAREYSPLGVRINTLYPGVFMTDLAAATAFPTEELRAFQLAKIPARRFGDPAEAGAAAVFLASDESRDITGADLALDGGRLAP
jgi:NAD(P)-dependent dehydrogenase (short-subunit alcohol dehydrogenase family)